MDNIEYANAYSEVLEILKYISKEEYNKIPKELIEVYEKNANKDYHFNYNPSKTLDEQNTSLITKGIIAILFRDYWATDSQREEIRSKQNQKRMLIEEEKKNRYNANDLFKNKEKLSSKISEDYQIAIKENGKWYKRILKFIKNLFKF